MFVLDRLTVFLIFCSFFLIVESQHRHKKAVFYSASILEGLTSHHTPASNELSSSAINKTKLFTTYIEPLKYALKYIPNNLLAHRTPGFRVPIDLEKLRKSLFSGDNNKKKVFNNQQQKEADKFFLQQIQNHSKDFLCDRHVDCCSSSCLKVYSDPITSWVLRIK